MSTKIFNTRLQLKYDSYANWSDESKQFKLLAGEIAVVSVPAVDSGAINEDAPGYNKKPAILFKVGDNEHTFNDLPWASGLAADVYEWAKREKGLASDIIYKPEVKDETGTVVTDAIYVNTAISSLEASVKTLEGIFSEEGEDGTVTGISDIIKNYIDTNLNKADSAQTGKYVSAVSQSNGVISVERADLPTYTLTTGDTNGTVKFNGTDVAVKGLGSAAYKDESAFDAEGTGAAEAAKVLGTDADVAGTATVHGALKSAAAAQSAAEAAQTTANAAYVLPEGGIEADLSDAVKASLAKADSALQTHQDISHLATKETVNGIDGRVGAIEADYLKAADKTALEGKITTAETNAKAYADEIKADLLGDDLADTFNTLKDVQDWVNTHGVEATKLATALADETKAREDADKDFETRVSALEGKVDVEKVSDAIAAGVAGEATIREEADTALSNRIKAYEDVKDAYALKTEVEAAEGRAAADATSKANAAEANAKAYTDAEIDKIEAEVDKKANTADLHKVATSGKIEDLDQEVEYIIFNCGTATTLVSDPVTE